MPEDLRPQIPLTREATRAFNLACLEQEGFEADDIIASLACRARDAGGRVTILSSRQGPDAARRAAASRCSTPMKNLRIDARRGAREVRRRTRACRGRAGAGGRLGRQRARRAGDRDQDGRASDQRVRRPRDAAGARRGDQAAQAPADADRHGRSDPHVEAAGAARLQDGPRLRAREPRGARARHRGAGRLPAADGVPHHRQAGQPSAGTGGRADGRHEPGGRGTGRVARCAGGRAVRPRRLRVHPRRGRAVGLDRRDPRPWAGWRSTPRPPASTRCAASWWGSSPGGRAGPGVLSAAGHTSTATTFWATDRPRGRWTGTRRWRCCAPVLEDPSILKIAQNAKYDVKVMARCGIEVAPVDDTMLMSYALNAGLHNHGMDELAERYLGHACHADQGADRVRQEPDHLRQGAGRRRLRLCRRGRRRDAAPVGDVQARSSIRAGSRRSTRRWSGR